MCWPCIWPSPHEQTQQNVCVTSCFMLSSSATCQKNVAFYIEILTCNCFTSQLLIECLIIGCCGRRVLYTQASYLFTIGRRCDSKTEDVCSMHVCSIYMHICIQLKLISTCMYACRADHICRVEYELHKRCQRPDWHARLQNQALCCLEHITPDPHAWWNRAVNCAFAPYHPVSSSDAWTTGVSPNAI